MASGIKFDIWTDPQASAKLQNLANELQYIAATLKESTTAEIVKRLTYEGGYKAVEYNSQAPQSNAQKSTVDFGVEETHGHISLVGPGAIYDEFGTGERGADDGHPLKGNFGLNAYMSGPFVSTHINKNGRHYWFAPEWSSDPYMYMNGYTEGIPSGKQIYNTLQYVNKIKGKVVSEEVNKALRTLK